MIDRDLNPPDPEPERDPEYYDPALEELWEPSPAKAARVREVAAIMAQMRCAGILNRGERKMAQLGGIGMFITIRDGEKDHRLEGAQLARWVELASASYERLVAVGMSPADAMRECCKKASDAILKEINAVA
jgi:hypothetical protein